MTHRDYDRLDAAIEHFTDSLRTGERPGDYGHITTAVRALCEMKERRDAAQRETFPAERVREVLALWARSDVRLGELNIALDKLRESERK